MPFLRVVLDGQYFAQNIVNVLWYRTTSPIPTLLDFLGYAEAVAAEVRENIWGLTGLSPGVAPYRLKQIMPAGYILQAIEVGGYGEDGLTLSTEPYSLAINEPGLWSDLTDGPAITTIVRMNLEPSFGPGVGLPKRGYLAVGPVRSDLVENTGYLSAPGIVVYNGLGVHLAADIVTEAPPGVFFPVRVRFNTGGIPFPIGYRDVSSCTVRGQVSFRRSRNNLGEV